MAQPFTTRYPLVDSQGNFGAIDGSPPAAMRYTEARTGAIPRSHLLDDLDKDTVDHGARTTTAPSMQPVGASRTRFPKLLCNGSTGIAVGMAASLRPAQPARGRDRDSTGAPTSNPAITTRRAAARSCPDRTFPTGGTIMGRSGIRNAYAAVAAARSACRAEYHVEEKKRAKAPSCSRRCPYQVKTEHDPRPGCQQLAKSRPHRHHQRRQRRVERSPSACGSWSSSRSGVDDELVTVNLLYKLTPLQSTFSDHQPGDRSDGRPRHARPQGAARVRIAITASTSSAGARAFCCGRPRTASTSWRALRRRGREHRRGHGDHQERLPITDELRGPAAGGAFRALRDPVARSILEHAPRRSLTGLEIEKLESEYKPRSMETDRLLQDDPLRPRRS